MVAFVARGLLATVPVLAMVAILVPDGAAHARPIRPAIIAGDNATAAQIAEIRDKLGLSEPNLGADAPSLLDKTRPAEHACNTAGSVLRRSVQGLSRASKDGGG
jgi:hypothetical protein